METKKNIYVVLSAVLVVAFSYCVLFRKSNYVVVNQPVGNQSVTTSDENMVSESDVAEQVESVKTLKSTPATQRYLDASKIYKTSCKRPPLYIEVCEIIPVRTSCWLVQHPKRILDALEYSLTRMTYLLWIYQ